jgi:hypothetical protein
MDKASLVISVGSLLAAAECNGGTERLRPMCGDSCGPHARDPGNGAQNPVPSPGRPGAAS